MSTTLPIRGETRAVRRAPRQGTARGGRWRRTGSQILAIAIFLSVWAGLARTGAARIGDVPGPGRALRALADLVGTEVWWSALGDSLLSWALGFGAAALIGVPAGLAIGASRFAMASSRLTIDFLRTIPPVALIPLTALLFGPTRPMVVTLAVIGAVWPLVVQAIYAAQQADPVLRQVASSFRLSRRHRILHLRLPSSLLFIWTGLRVGANVALLVVIAGELLGGVPGIGNQLNQSLLADDNASVFAYALTAGVLGVLQNAFFVGVQRRLLHWHPAVRGEGR